MRIVILDGFSVNPGDLSWDELNQFGEVIIYERTSEDEVIDRCKGAAPTSIHRRSRYRV